MILFCFVFFKDVVETTLALDNFKRACDCGRGAVFLSVARGKVKGDGGCVRKRLGIGNIFTSIAWKRACGLKFGAVKFDR